MDIERTKNMIRKVKDIRDFIQDINQMEFDKITAAILPSYEALEGMNPKQINKVLNETRADIKIENDSDEFKKLVCEYFERKGFDLIRDIKEEITGEKSEEEFNDSLGELIESVESKEEMDGLEEYKEAIFEGIVKDKYIMGIYETNGSQTKVILKEHPESIEDKSGNIVNNVFYDETEMSDNEIVDWMSGYEIEEDLKSYFKQNFAEDIKVIEVNISE